MNFIHWSKRRAWEQGLAGVILILALAGCSRDDEAKVYNVPKDQAAPPAQAPQTPPPEPAVAPQAAMPETPAPPSDATSVSPIKYELPQGWQEKTAGEMRVASFAASGPNGQSADISVIPLPVVGRDLELINMWRSRVQLPATSDPAAAGQAKPVAIGGDQGRLFEFVSDQPIMGKSRQRIVVAMLTRGTMSWFFKITGDDDLVTSQKDKFLQFLKSVSFVDQAPPSIADATTSSAPPTAPAGNDNTGSIWTIPPNWQSVPPSEFLLVEFSIPGPGGAKASVNVAEMGGEGGGLLANVNRWRGQLSLSALSENDLSPLTQKLDILGGTAPMVDFTGVDAKTGTPTRLIAVIVSQNGQTWFYKLMGDPKVVTQQQTAFTKFIQSANYANAR